jgi:hypothetical protein
VFRARWSELFLFPANLRAFFGPPYAVLKERTSHNMSGNLEKQQRVNGRDELDNWCFNIVAKF